MGYLEQRDAKADDMCPQAASKWGVSKLNILRFGVFLVGLLHLIIQFEGGGLIGSRS